MCVCVCVGGGGGGMGVKESIPMMLVCSVQSVIVAGVLLVASIVGKLIVAGEDMH